MTNRPRPLLGLFAGVAAGLVASAAMAAFQARTKALLSEQGGGDDPATFTAADAVTEAVIADAVPEPYREPASHAVHYIVGGVLGGIYGVLTEYRPEARTGFGSAYGIATAALLDEIAVPMTGPGPVPDETPLAAQAQGAASHLVYGWVLEGVRWLIAGKR